MVPLYDSPLWTLRWEDKSLKEFHFLKKQNLESAICYAIDLPLLNQTKPNTKPKPRTKTKPKTKTNCITNAS